MNVIDIAFNLHLTPIKVSSTKGGEYASACPMCGGRDRFRLWPESGDGGLWWCRGCNKGGDAIQLLRDAKGMTFKEACVQLGRQTTAMKRGRTPILPSHASKEFVPKKSSDPACLWQSRAIDLVSAAEKALLADSTQLGWLEGRGITAAAISRFRLGWLPKDRWLPKTSWGLDDNGKKLWLPAGFFIPWFTGEDVHRIRIRRPQSDAEPRYYIVPGSGTSPMMIPPAIPSGRAAAWVIVESELDAILIAQEAGDLAGCAGLGSVAIKPDSALYAELKKAACILVSLDADEAGAKAWPWWKAHFPQADRWPVPRGKDPGDYRKDGGDIREWIISGLPPGLRPAAAIEAPGDDIITEMARCPRCGKVFETYGLKSSAPYRGLCYRCL